PFVTEEIWQKLPKPSTAPASLMVTVFPTKDARFVDEDAEQKMSLLQEVTVAIRMLRGTYNVPPSWSVPVDLHASDEARRGILERHRDVIENGARVTLTITATGARAAQSAKAVVGADVEIIMPLAGLVDISAEKARIAKEIAKADKDIGGLEKKLANADFIAR